VDAVKQSILVAFYEPVQNFL